MKRFVMFVLVVAILQSYCLKVFSQSDDDYEWEWRPLSTLVDRYKVNTGYKVSSINKTVLIGAIALKQNLPPNLLFPGYVYLSEKPKGEKAGEYTINSSKLSFTNGNKQNKIKYSDMTERTEGWRSFGFGENKNLYLREVEDNALIDNVLVLCAISKKTVSNIASTNQENKSLKDNPLFIMQYAAETNNATQGSNYGTKEIKMTTPEKEGYTLLNTKTIEGIKCDYYMEAVRTFRFDDGDFVTYMSKDKWTGKDSERKPYDNGEDNPVGDWQLTSVEGDIVKKQNGVVKIDFPNGCSVVNRNGAQVRWRSEDKKPLIYSSWCFGDRLYLPNKKQPLDYVKITFNQWSKSGASLSGDMLRRLRYFDSEGYYQNNRLYAVNKDGECYAYKQIVNGIPIDALDTDSIVDLKLTGDGMYLSYANGDKVEYNIFSNTITSCNIHRNGGVLTVKSVNGSMVKVLTFSNGDKYVGDFIYNNVNPMTHNYHTNMTGLSLETLGLQELKFGDGTLIKTDGTRIQYKSGKTEKEILAEQQAVVAKANKLYSDLCKQYGQRYVDAALSQKPVVGMPEALLKEAFRLQPVQQGSLSIYRILGWGWKRFGTVLSDTAHLYTVWVQNGRVTKVIFWNN